MYTKLNKMEMVDTIKHSFESRCQGKLQFYIVLMKSQIILTGQEMFHCHSMCFIGKQRAQQNILIKVFCKKSELNGNIRNISKGRYKL